MAEKTELLARELSQNEWEEMLVHTGMDKLNLTQDTLSLMRVCFALGFNSGAECMMDVIKDIYNKNIDLFEGLFNGGDDLYH